MAGRTFIDRLGSLLRLRRRVLDDDPMRIWAKLAWDVEMFGDLGMLYPDERARLRCSAVQICVTAWRLRVWTEQELARRSGWKNRLSGDDVQKRLTIAVPQQILCDAVADVARRAYWRDGIWPDDLLRMEWGSGGWILSYPPLGISVPMLAFLRIEQSWRAFLESEGLVPAPRKVAGHR